MLPFHVHFAAGTATGSLGDGSADVAWHLPGALGEVDGAEAQREGRTHGLDMVDIWLIYG